MAAAQEWQGLGRLDHALHAYAWLIDNGEEGAEPLIRRAALWTGLGRLELAEADLLRGAAQEPDQPWALLRLALLRHTIGRQAAAAEAAGEAVRRTPWFGEAHANAALVYLHLEWLDLARRAAVALGPDAAGWWAGVRERGLRSHREQHGAVMAALGARRAEGPPPDPWELALGLFRLGRLRAARRLCEAMAAQGGRGCAPLELLARITARESGPAAAAESLRPAAEAAGADPACRAALVMHEHDAGRLDAVLRLLGEPAADQPGALRHVRAVADAVLGREDELRRFCAGWMEAAPMETAPAGFIASAELRARPLAAAAAAADADVADVRLAQFWDAPEPPEDVAEVMASWTAHHPGLARTLFDQEAARAYLLAGYGREMAETFDLCRHAAMKADLFRLAWLHLTGGVWADADELCLRAMPGLLAHAAETELTAPLSGDLPGYVHNFFLGARPGGPLLAAALEEACAGVRRVQAADGKPDIWLTTGPGLVTRAVARHLLTSRGAGRPSDVTLLASVQYGAFARTEDRLAYKRDRANNWHLS